MIRDLDLGVERLLELEFGSPLPFDLTFTRPDRSFSPVSKTKLTLDCYLYDIREDRELRRVPPVVSRRPDGTVATTPAPIRIRSSYCITAWSPADRTTGAVPEFEEHQLLGQVLAALLKHPTLPTAALLGSLVGQEPPLPAGIVMPDPGHSMRDFWNALGGQLRPSLDYGITLSLAYLPSVVGPMVTTLVTSYGERPDLPTPDTWIEIGGIITDDTPLQTPIGDAWVLLQEHQRVSIADADGRFQFARVPPGPCTLRARAMGYQEGSRALQVPDPTGDYTLGLTPI